MRSWLTDRHPRGRRISRRSGPCSPKAEVIETGLGPDEPSWFEGLSESEHEAFEDMLTRLESDPRDQLELSEKQRAWVYRRADELDVIVESPAERNKDVPKGREVELSPVLQNRPKKPPGRR